MIEHKFNNSKVYKYICISGWGFWHILHHAAIVHTEHKKFVKQQQIWNRFMAHIFWHFRSSKSCIIKVLRHKLMYMHTIYTTNRKSAIKQPCHTILVMQCCISQVPYIKVIFPNGIEIYMHSQILYMILRILFKMCMSGIPLNVCAV